MEPLTVYNSSAFTCVYSVTLIYVRPEWSRDLCSTCLLVLNLDNRFQCVIIIIILALSDECI